MIRKKTGFWTFIFSLIPGAGEMYMGFFKQGAVLMLAFFADMAISAGWFGILAMFMPIIWFYSFFHVHNLASLPDEEFYALEDSYFGAFAADTGTLPKFLSSKKGIRIIGILLVIIGAGALWDALRSLLFRYLDEAVYSTYIRPLLDNIPNMILGIAIILIGIWLIRGKKKELLNDKPAVLTDSQHPASDKQED